MSLAEGAPERRAPLAVLVDITAPLWRALLTRRVADVVAAGTFALVLALVAVFAVWKPSPNWDAIPYAALVSAAPGDAATDIHAKGYATIREVADAATYQALTHGDGYRTRQAEDPRAFASMLPMYAVKAGYIAAARALAPVIGVWGALTVLNLVGLALLGGVTLWWLWRSDALQAAPLALLVAMLLDLRELVAGATPALMAAGLVVLATLLLAKETRGAAIVAGVALIAATTFRPDTLLFAFALLLAFALAGRSLVRVGLVFIATLATYLMVTSGTGHIGWWAHFVFSNGGYQHTLEGFDPAFSPLLYAKAVARGGLMALVHFDWPVLALALLGGWAMLKRISRTDGVTDTLLLALLLAVGGKFATFPLPDDRIYLGFALAAALLLLARWKPRAIQ